MAARRTAILDHVASAGEGAAGTGGSGAKPPGQAAAA
jgi:hypothetical protein